MFRYNAQITSLFATHLKQCLNEAGSFRNFFQEIRAILDQNFTSCHLSSGWHAATETDNV